MLEFYHTVPFRVHPAVCPPYNADFDGDEMNLHVPQSQRTGAGSCALNGVRNQIISPRYGGPIIGGIRDFITGAFLLTSDETFLTIDEITNLALFDQEDTMDLYLNHI